MSGKIQNYLKYKKCFSALEKLYQSCQKKPEKIDKLLAEYCTFTTENWVYGYPLLLKDGEHLPLNRTPNHIYLLPPIDSLPDNERLILCQFPKEASHQQGFRIVHWTLASTDINQQLSNKSSPFWEIEYKENVSFAGRVNKIKFESEDDEYTLRLYFDAFILRITFFLDNSEKMQSRWISRKDSKTKSAYWHRASYGKMKPILRVEVNEDQVSWQNDTLHLPNKEKLNHALGYINGIDSPENSDHIYAANNEAFIFAFNANKQPIKTKRFSGICQDILSIPHTNNEAIDAVITPCDDGTVWIIENRENTLKKLHYQLTSEKITRILGFGTNQIITLNHLNQLVPMRVNKVGVDSGKIYHIRDFLWDKIYAKEKNNEAWADLAYRDQLIKLAFSQFSKDFFQHKNKNNKLNDNERYWIELLFTSIKKYHKTQNEPEKESNFLIHEYLLTRLWRSLRSHLYISPHKSSMNDISLSDVSWDSIWCLIELPDNAPDALWFNVFRHYDWLDLFIDEIDNASNKKALSKIKAKAAQRFVFIINKRKQLNACYAQYRPLEITSSKRLISPARHIHEFDREQHLICYTNYKKELYITKTPSAATLLWQNISIIPHGKYWHGLPRTIVAGDRLQSLFPQLQRPLFLATNRGELRLFSSKKEASGSIKLQLEAALDYSIEASVCHPVEHHAHYIGLMLVGKNIKRRAMIDWLSFIIDEQTKKISIHTKALWQDSKKGGILRMLNVVGAPEKPKTLLATDSELGKLHLWPLTFKRRLNHFEPIIDQVNHRNFLDEQRGLSALAINSYEAPKKLVTGGKNGIAIAYKYASAPEYPYANKSKKLPHLTPDWVMRCGKNLSRAIYIQDQKTKKCYWLLCSDNADLQILNADTGCLESVFEYIGGVTGARNYDCGQKAVIGTTHGRLIQLSLSQKTSSTAPINLPPEVILKTTNPETLTLMSTLLNKIKENKNIKDPDWFNDLSPTVLALCFGEFRLKKDAKSIHRLLLIAWKNIQNKEFGIMPANDLLLIMMHFAENWQRQRTPKVYIEEEKLIAKKLLQYLWNIDPEDNKDCPLLKDRPRLRILKLGQAFRLINVKILDINQNQLAQVVNQWLIDLAKMWQFSNTTKLSEIDYFKYQLNHLLAEKVHILPLKWQTYLAALANPKKKEDFSININLIPNELKKLWIHPEIKILSLTDFNLLKKTFNENKGWQIWLTELQAILKQLEKDKKTNPHIAWQEKARLTQLEDHFIDHGYKRFIEHRIHSLPLVALFWQSLSYHWAALIKKQLNDLDQKSIENKYVFFKKSGKWIDSNTYRLKLNIYNNGTLYIKIASFNYDSATNAEDNQSFDNMVDTIISTSKAGIEQKITLKTNINNQIKGYINIVFTNELSEKEKNLEIKIDDKRSISLLRETAGYEATDIYLIQSLTTEQTHIYWLDGDFWSDNERKTFLHESAQIKKSTVTISKINRLGKVKINDNTIIFCPDLPLSGTDPTQLIRRFHVLLYHLDENSFSALSFSLWHWAKPLPNNIAKILKDQLLTYLECENLLNRLFNHNPKILALLKQGIQSLDNRMLGNWCAGEPINDSNLYIDSVSALNQEIWKKLIKHQLWDWPRVIDQNEQALIKSLISYYETAEPMPHLLSQNLLSFIGQPIKDNCFWRVKKFLFILEIKYNGCWIMPKEITTQQQKIIEAHQDSFFLQLSTIKQDNLPHNILSINFLQCLRLLFTPLNKSTKPLMKGENATYDLLNGWAALTTKVDATKIFQISNGMATGAEIRHFVGRDDEMIKIHNLLNNADNNNTGYKGLAILGARKIGKTSLLQHIVKSLKHERLILNLDCSLWPRTSYDANIIEQSFFRTCQQEINQYCTDKFIFSWQYSGNSTQQDKTHEAFENYLIDFKKRTGKAVLLIFDETDMLLHGRLHLIKSLFDWLRSLMNAGHLAWIATGFPRGQSVPDCLQAQITNAASPLYNTMELIYLKPWNKSVSWRFLRSRLALLGIRLADEYCDQVWDNAQGLPSVIHRMGVLFSAYQNSGRRTVITLSQATAVFDQIKKENRAFFEITIENMVQDIERNHPLDKIQKEHSFAEHRLVHALRQLAIARATNPKKTLSLSEIHAALEDKGNRRILKEILDAMTHLSIISSLNTKDDYQFTNGVYPQFFSKIGAK